MEKEFGISLPSDYREFLKEYGDLWNPEILDLIVENDLEIADVQDFWSIETIKHDKENEWTSTLGVNLIPFASDCMGNIFGVKTDEIKKSSKEYKIYFFDHDFDTLEPISNSFLEWIDDFLKIKE